jgi:ribosomal-protein-alanine N-acetyltransferase
MLGFGKIEDANLFSEIHRQAFPQGWRAEQIEESLRNKNIYAIRYGDIGFVLFQLLGEECEIVTMAVLPKFQGRGIAREMIIEMLGICMAMQVKKVFLEVSTNNEKAQSLYRKFTFTEYNQRSKYYADGSDAVLLQLLL